MQLFFYIVSMPAVRLLLRAMARVAAAWYGHLRACMTGRKTAALFASAVEALQALIIMAMVPAVAVSAVSGDQIVNSAQFAAGGTPIATARVNVTVLTRTPSRIEFLKYAPGGTPVTVAPSWYRTSADPSAPLAAMLPPVSSGAALPLNLANPVPLAPVAIVHQGDPIFIRVTDQDQNLDLTRSESVMVTITDDTTGDREIVRLTETGPNTGVFVGYIQTSGNASPSPYDGLLSVTTGGNVKASYSDIVDPSDTSSTSAAVDPFGIVFNSATGAPINGVKITLIDAASGNPATVYGDDGVSTFPSAITTGSTVTDSGGRLYNLPPGGFRFPFVLPGRYQFQVAAPAGFSGPSTVTDATLQALPGGPFALVNPGSRLDQFTINPGPALHIDIPLDPNSSALWLQKSAGKDTVAVGDFLPYELDVQTTNKAGATTGVVITDVMPLGFRFRHGSVRCNGAVAPDPVISADGRTLSFAAGDIAPQAVVSIRYVVEVSAGAGMGIAVNQATASGMGGITSNLAKASVQVKSDFLSSRSVLMGQVVVGACGDKNSKAMKGLEGIRIFLEDGTFVDTDKNGMFHFEGVAPGTHVAQLDLDSLPNDYQVISCEENTRFAGPAYSQFVDLQGGSLWRADFHVAHKAKLTNPPSPSPLPAGNEMGVDPAKAGAKENEHAEKEGFLSPRNDAVLVNSVNTVRVCVPIQLVSHLFIDGNEVPADRIGFTMKDNNSGKVIYSYIGVDLGKEGWHTLRLQGTDPFGNTRFDQSVKVIRSSEIAGIRLKSAAGNIADGKTPVSLQIELMDASGRVIPAEADLEVRGGTLSPVKKQGEALESSKDKAVHVHVDTAGNALFQPVNTSGPYRVVLGYNKAALEVETYVKPMMRDWILVGLGEGTVGYDTVAGHIENLQGPDQQEQFYDKGRLAFYAKGKVKGEWLLTMAYDNSKARTGAGNNSLFQSIDPNTYYTLYGDATQQKYDASSARRLYLKIERDQFYALFGDFDTNLTTTELSRYSRRMNGVKTEYQGGNIEANVFGSETAQAYARDEIRGDGTSGLYHLSRKGIVLNSDKITIETRDRFRSEIIISSVPMSRFTDYSIDYDSGTVFFKQPIMSRDDNFNPIFIVVEYEVFGSSQAYTYGGRVGTKLLDQKLKAGVTYIHEGQVSGDGNSYGLDASYKIADGTTVKVEVAKTDTQFGNTVREGNAYIAELDHHSKNLETRLYVREFGEGFGLGQQNGSENATRKGGVDAAYKLTDTISLGGQAYRQYNLSTGGVQDVVEGKTSYSSGPYNAHLGLRQAGDKLGDGSVNTSDQVTTGASWLTLDKRLTLRVDHDQSIGSNNNASFPTRTTFGTDFKLSQKVALFAQEEITSGSTAKTNTTSVGMKAAPWEGSALNTSMGQNLNENGDRMFALYGLKQTWKITDKWSVDGGLDRSQTIKNSNNYQFNTNVPPASGDNQDFTAVSVGTTYTEKKWNWNTRVEERTSDMENKWGGVTAFVGEPKDGWGWSARCQVFDTKSAADSETLNSDLRLGMVYRPVQTNWIILDRLDFLYDKQQGGTAASTAIAGTSFDTENRRIVNNLSANFKLENKTQISLFYGAKYVLETIDGANYSGFTDLVGIEARYDLTKKWDIGIRGSVLHSWHSSQVSYSAGPSVGYNIFKNAWVSIGYNFVGFSDKDFSASNYTKQGPYVRFRFKFDQNSVKEAIASMNHE